MPKTKKKPFDPDEFLFDLFGMSREKVQKMLFKEFDKTKLNFEKIKVMLDSGLVDNAKNEYGETPLHLVAGGRNDLNLAKLLLDRGADVNAKNDDGHTPLHYACEDYSDDYEFVKLLLDRGADVRAKTNGDSTPIDMADTEEMKTLLKKYKK